MIVEGWIRLIMLLKNIYIYIELAKLMLSKHIVIYWVYGDEMIS